MFIVTKITTIAALSNGNVLVAGVDNSNSPAILSLYDYDNIISNNQVVDIVTHIVGTADPWRCGTVVAIVVLRNDNFAVGCRGKRSL